MELLEYLQKYQDNLSLIVDTCPGLVRQKFWLINAQEELQIIKNNYGDLLEDEIDIDSLIFEANWLKEITSDLLSDDDFLIALEWGRETSIKEQLKQLEKSLKITLEIDNEQALRQQLQQIQLYQDQIREIQLNLDKSTQTLAESDNEVEIIKKLIYLLEESVFSIEGYSEDGELLIAYAGQIKKLNSILEQDCEFIKLLSNTLLGQANNLRKQAEQSIKQLEEERRRQEGEENLRQIEERRQRETAQIRIQNEQIKPSVKRSRLPIKALLVASTVAALGYTGWTSRIATPQIQQLLNNLHLSQNTDEQKPNSQPQRSANLETTQKLNAEQQTSANLAILETPNPEPQTLTSLENSQKLNSEQETSVNLDAIQKPNPEQQAATNLETAQKLAMEAAVMTQNSPHPLEIWQKSQAKWQEAVNVLEAIPENLAISAKAKEKLANYRINFTAISNRIITEEKASTNLETAQKLAMEASVMMQNSSQSAEIWQQAKAKLQEAISLLEAIPNNTFVTAQAKDKLTIYRTNYAVASQK